jgi:peptide chain release factor 1
VRLTHLPTGIVISCQDEKSQLQNKLKAMRILRSRLLEMEEQKRQQERWAQRGAARSAPATAARRSAPTTSRRVASPTTASARRSTSSTAVMNGDLDDFIEELAAFDQAERLHAMSDENAA